MKERKKDNKKERKKKRKKEKINILKRYLQKTKNTNTHYQSGSSLLDYSPSITEKGDSGSSVRHCNTNETAAGRQSIGMDSITKLMEADVFELNIVH